MFLWTKMAKLSPIDFKISLLVDLVNNGQNKFEVDISKHVAKISNFGPKQATLARGLLMGISRYFFKITFFLETNRMVTKAELYLLLLRFWFIALFFAPKPRMGRIACMDPKPPSSGGYVSWPSQTTFISKQCLKKYRPVI